MNLSSGMGSPRVADDSTLRANWERLRAEFPLHGYLGLPDGHYQVARTVTSLLPSGSSVLDFGCGPGDKTAFLQMLGYSVVGVDDFGDAWHGRHLDDIHEFAQRVGFELRSAGEADLPPGPFDAVMLHHVLEHLHDSPRALLLDLLGRVRPGGIFFATVPNHANIRKRIHLLVGKTTHAPFNTFYWYPGPWRGHVREYTRDDCHQLLDYLGLEFLEVKGVHHMLQRVPERGRRLYDSLTSWCPNVRDTWSIVGRKPVEWSPASEPATAAMPTQA